jgi:hypothetical protein
MLGSWNGWTRALLLIEEPRPFRMVGRESQKTRRKRECEGSPQAPTMLRLDVRRGLHQKKKKKKKKKKTKKSSLSLQIFSISNELNVIYFIVKI